MTKPNNNPLEFLHPAERAVLDKCRNRKGQALSVRTAKLAVRIARESGVFLTDAELAERDGTCKWKEDEDGNWSTECGRMHIFFTGNPTENRYSFCPYCGNRVEVVESKEAK